MREALTAWGRKRWPDCRAVHEMMMPTRKRIDMVFITAKDLIGVEIKGPRDNLAGVKEQLDSYRRWLPEVWLAAAPKWREHSLVRWEPNRLEVAGDKVLSFVREGRRPARDECVVTPLLKFLWRDELARVAQRTDVIPGTKPCGDPAWKIRPMLARLLTGNEVIREVCLELRGRAGFGFQSEGALERPVHVAKLRKAAG